MRIPQQLIDEFAALPDVGFWGSVEVSFRDSIPGIIKIIRTKQLEPNNGETETNGRTRTR